MKTGLFCFLTAVFAGSMALPQTAPTTATKKTGTKTKTANKTGTSTTTAARKKTGAKTASKRKTVVAAAPRQATPTADRYREIQQALVDKGYLKAEPNAVWDDQSSQALKQFQTDQHISPTGKISALSLIDLGLGPRSASNAAAPLPGPAALQGTHPPEPADLPPSPETIPAPDN
jgi:hypothetical protein